MTNTFRSRKAEPGKEGKGIHREEDVDKNQGHVVSCLHGLDASDDETPVPTSQYIKHMVAEEQEKKAKKGIAYFPDVFRDHFWFKTFIL